MSSLLRLVRQTLTIARRDFVATVFTPTFLIFLFAPLLMLGFGLIGGLGAAKVNDSGADKAAIVAIVPPSAHAEAMRAADLSLRRVFRASEMPPPLRTPLIGVPCGRPVTSRGVSITTLTESAGWNVSRAFIGSTSIGPSPHLSACTESCQCQPVGSVRVAITSTAPNTRMTKAPIVAARVMLSKLSGVVLQTLSGAKCAACMPT